MLPVSTVIAMSSLAFAAERCGELPELRPLRTLFKERYGREFELANVKLLIGNMMNFPIEQYLCINSVQENMKQKLINEIAKDRGLPPVFLDPEVSS